MTLLRHAGRALAALLALAAPQATAQSVGARRVQLELRSDVLVARTTAVHVGAGANVVAGTYARVALMGAGGVRRVHEEWRSSGRVDAVVRVHLDPLRQFAWGAYAGGGATVLFDADARSRTRAVVVVGYEGPPSRRGWILGVEAGAGGGVRIALAARRARTVGR